MRPGSGAVLSLIAARRLLRPLRFARAEDARASLRRARPIS